MSNLLFHGDNQVASRTALHQAVKAERGGEVIKLDGSKISETDLRQALESQSLFRQERTGSFGQEKLVVIDKLPIKLIDILSQHQDHPSVFIWHNKALTPTQLKKLSNFKPQLFKIPAVIFNFLDSLKSGNAKAVVTAFEKSVAAEPVEQVFYMLHRRVSQLIQAQDAPQTLKISDWQKSRLINQSKTFTLDQLLTLHFKLLTIDVSIKTGVSITPITTILEFLLLNL